MGEILKNIGAAFVGGLILNVMPCVLPVLTM
jgi:thiol:disulfide interchange protein